MGVSSGSKPSTSSSSSAALFASCAGSNGTYDVDGWLNERRDAIVVLNNVSYYREPMDHHAGIYHDFLVVEVEPFEFNGSRTRTLEIKAHKLFQGRGQEVHVEVTEPGGKLEIKTILDLPTTVVKEHAVNMQGCGEMQMSALLGILGGRSTVYDLCKNNCWKYAYDTLRTLIQGNLNLAGTSIERKTDFLTKFRTPDLPNDVLAQLATFSSVSCVGVTPFVAGGYFVIPVSSSTIAAMPMGLVGATLPGHPSNLLVNTTRIRGFK